MDRRVALRAPRDDKGGGSWGFTNDQFIWLWLYSNTLLFPFAGEGDLLCHFVGLLQTYMAAVTVLPETSVPCFNAEVPGGHGG